MAGKVLNGDELCGRAGRISAADVERSGSGEKMVVVFVLVTDSGRCVGREYGGESSGDNGAVFRGS